MTWHKSFMRPERGATVLVKYKGCSDGNYFKIKVREEDSLAPIEKWCYLEDYENAKKRKISNEI